MKALSTNERDDPRIDLTKIISGVQILQLDEPQGCELGTA